MTGEGLLDLGVHITRGIPHGDELGLRPLADEGRAHRGQRNDAQGDHREQRRDGEHHDPDAQQHEDRVEQLTQGLLQSLGDVVDVVGHPAQQLATRLAVEIGQR